MSHTDNMVPGANPKEGPGPSKSRQEKQESEVSPRADIRDGERRREEIQRVILKTRWDA